MAETKKFNVMCICMACYNSSIEVPADYTFEQAVEYAKDHIDEIPIDSDLEYISDTDELDEENCSFEEVPEGDNILPTGQA